jgi:hypothetical protein
VSQWRPSKALIARCNSGPPRSDSPRRAEAPRRGPVPPWTDGPAGCAVGPAAGHQLAMPAQQPRRAHQERCPPPTWKHPRECREHGSIRSRRGRVSCRRNTITSWRSTSSSMSLAASPRARRTISSSTRRSTSYTTETTTAGDLPRHPGRNPPERPGHSQHQHSEARHGSSVEPATSGSPLGDSG